MSCQKSFSWLLKLRRIPRSILFCCFSVVFYKWYGVVYFWLRRWCIFRPTHILYITLLTYLNVVLYTFVGGWSSIVPVGFTLICRSDVRTFVGRMVIDCIWSDLHTDRICICRSAMHTFLGRMVIDCWSDLRYPLIEPRGNEPNVFLT